MLIGKVVGSVVATRKNDNLVGNKFMIVELVADMGETKKIVAIEDSAMFTMLLPIKTVLISLSYLSSSDITSLARLFPF